MILKNKKTREFSRVFLISNSEFQISNLILLLVLHIAGEALPKIFLRDKELLDCEECGDTNNANDVADPVGVIDNNVMDNNTMNDGLLDNVGNAATDIIDGVGNAANDLINGTPDTPMNDTSTAPNSNVNSVTERTR